MRAAHTEPPPEAARFASAPARACLLILMVLGLMTTLACSGVRDLREDEVAGTWTSADGGTFRFAADGTFTASDLRGEAMAADSGGRVSGGGTWRLTPNLYDPKGTKTEILLVFDHPTDRIGCSLFYLIADFDDPTLALFSYVDDPDLNIQYRFSRTNTAAVGSTAPSDATGQCPGTTSDPAASPTVA